jgi:hypothetical protein
LRLIGQALDISSSDADEAIVSVPLTGSAQAVSTHKIAVTPVTHNFGTVKSGEASSPVEITIRNNGARSLGVASIDLSNASVFSLVPASTNRCSDAPFFLNAGQSCNIAATIKPSGYGDWLGVVTIPGLTIAPNDPVQPSLPLAFRGEGTNSLEVPALRLQPDVVDFGEVLQGRAFAAQQVTLTNLGDTPVSLAAAGLIKPRGSRR